jgi:hypothetical protein
MGRALAPNSRKFMIFERNLNYLASHYINKNKKSNDNNQDINNNNNSSSDIDEEGGD